MRAEGINKADSFLRNACAQLIAVYHLPHAVLPPEATQDGGYLGKLLEEVSNRLAPDAKAVLVIDALDEVYTTGVPAGTNPLYLPVLLPPRVYIVATMQKVPLNVLADSAPQTLDIEQDSAGNVADIREYVRQAAARPKIQAAVAARGISLDYKRMAEVVNRIVLLSETRQVIVFTHNIWFTTELLARFEKRHQDCSYYDVSRDGAKIEIVSKGTHPRSDTYSNLRGRINTLVQSAGNSSGEPQFAMIEKAYELIRNICEVIVEQELLQGVTQRHQSMVRMTMLPKINFSGLEGGVTAIYPIYEDCCRYIGLHSQPIETLNARPTLETLKTDWNKVQQATGTLLYLIRGLISPLISD